MLMLCLLMVKLSLGRTGELLGTVKLELFSPKKSYSTFADQFGKNAHSTPAPANQPVLVLPPELVNDAHVLTLVIVKLLLRPNRRHLCHRRARDPRLHQAGQPQSLSICR